MIILSGYQVIEGMMNKKSRGKILFCSEDFHKMIKSKAALRGENIMSYTRRVAKQPRLFLDDNDFFKEKRVKKIKNGFEGFL